MVESDESSALTDGDWTFVVEDGSAVLTKYNGSNANSIVIPNTVTDGVSTYNVTSIRGDSSSNPAVSNTSLNQNCTLSLSSSLMSIGDYAFTNCTNFTGSITIPNNVQSIGYSAFYGCSGLIGNLTIPDTVTSISNRAFYGCSGLDGTLTIGSGVTIIGGYAFYECSHLTSLVFSPASQLTTIEISAFDRCSRLSGSLVIPNGVTTIGISAFAECYELTGSLTLPDSLLTLSADAFYVCQFTGTLDIPDSLTTLEEAVFYSNKFTAVNIPDSITSIGNHTFSGCVNLTSITLPDSITSIGDSAFYMCTGLAGNLELPMRVTTLGTNAFYNCSSLTSVTLKYYLSSIGNNAFYGCTSLATVYNASSSLTVTTGSTSNGYVAYYATDVYSCCTLTVTPNHNGWGTTSDRYIVIINGQTPTVSLDGLTITTSVPGQESTATANEGYRFEEWTNASEPVLYNRTITAVFKQVGVDYYTITINVNDPNYGSVNKQSITVVDGSAISVNWNRLTIGDETVIATPTQDSAQYNYSFDGWSPSSGIVVGDMTITATFTREIARYTITLIPNYYGWGTVDIPSVNVPYGTAVSANGNVLTIGSTTITATPSSTTVQYTYGFDSWSQSSGTVTGTDTITANFTRTTLTYSVTFLSSNSSWGTVDTNTIYVDYGTSVSASGNVLTVGTDTITATPTPNTQRYNYAFVSWSQDSGTITDNTTITATFSRTTVGYIVTFTSSDSNWGTLDVHSVIVPYGTSVSANGNVLTVGTDTITATPHADTAQYSYAFVSWSQDSGTITEDTDIIATFSRTTVGYVVTIVANNYGWGTVDTHSVTVPYGTSVSASGNILTIGSTTITATPASDTAQYAYGFDSWSKNSGAITDTTEITAYFTRTTLAYLVTIDTSNSSWGTVSPQSVLVPYGTPVSAIGNELTIGSDTIVATPSIDTVRYHYAFDNWSQDSGYITGTTFITATFTRTTVGFFVTFQPNDVSMGSVNVASVLVPNGTNVSADGNILTVGSTEVTATPQDDTAQYLFAFNDWSQDSGTITEDTIITANFTRTLRSYTVTISTNNAEYGTVSVDTISADYGTPISSHGTTLTVGSTSSVASETEDTAQYTYTFVRWEGVAPVVSGDCTITANFTRTLNHYTVSFTVAQGCGTWSVDTMNVAYGTAISLADMTVTVGDRTSVFTKTPDTESKAYVLDSLTIPVSVIESDLTVHADVSEYNQMPAFNIIQPQYEWGDAEPKEGPAWSLVLVIPILVIVGLIITVSEFMIKREEYDEF